MTRRMTEGLVVEMVGGVGGVGGNAEGALAALGISLEEAAEADERLKTKTVRDPRICLCGHAINKHQIINGIVMCAPSRMVCPCKGVRPVLQVEDVRMFLRKTTGPGVEHALVRGISALAKAGKSADWIVDLKCDRCSAPASADTRITPVPISAGMSVAYEATGRDALLCDGCMEEI